MSASAVAPTPLLSLDQAWLRYAHSAPWVLQNCSFELYANERILVTGPNGSGKSSLLKLLAGLLRPQQGQCARCQHQPCTCAYLAQESSIDWNLPVSVADMVRCGLSARRRWGIFPQAAEKQRLEEALSAVQLLELKHRPIAQLSGGQRQRLLIARTLAQGARVLLLDEPLSGLDQQARAMLCTVLERVCQDFSLSVVMSSHETAGFDFPFDRQVHLDAGNLHHGSSYAPSA